MWPSLACFLLLVSLKEEEKHNHRAPPAPGIWHWAQGTQHQEPGTWHPASAGSQLRGMILLSSGRGQSPSSGLILGGLYRGEGSSFILESYWQGLAALYAHRKHDT
jgi:hypothetical protein